MDVIHDDPPMRQEIAAGFYPGFEDRWSRAEFAGRAAMLLFVVACFLGLLGHGPLGERTRTTADGTLAARYEPVARFGTPTTITLDARVPPGADAIGVTLARPLFADLGLTTVTPRPTRWEAGADGIRLVIPVEAGTGRIAVQISGAAGSRGPIDLFARIDGGEALSWRQIVVP